jgi:hypothetical protein
MLKKLAFAGLGKGTCQMGKKVSNERAERVLYAFNWIENEDEKYAEFIEFHASTLKMVFHKYVGWTLGISESGYENVQHAYNQLVSLGYLDEITDEEIDYIVSMAEQSYGKPL